jgi:hypothetical protein
MVCLGDEEIRRRRLRANELAVSQKTYLELDEKVSSWIGTVVAMVWHILG